MSKGTQLTKTRTYDVGYQIPRHVIGAPGKQGRAGYGILTITPGATEPIEFAWNTVDGVPIELINWKPKLTFWQTNRQPTDISQDERVRGDSKIIMTLVPEVTSPHEGLMFILLSSDNTWKLARAHRYSPIRWGIFLEDPATGNMFPATVHNDGERFGTLRVEDAGGSLPSMEEIKGSGN